jgi:hypothetical protein
MTGYAGHRVTSRPPELLEFPNPHAFPGCGVWEPPDPVRLSETRHCRASCATAAGGFGNRRLHVRMAFPGDLAAVHAAARHPA